MREALRNIWRRKVRSALTIFGVAIGVFALTTMGALASSLNHSIGVGLDYYSHRIILGASGGGGLEPGLSTGPRVPDSLAQQAAVIDGVDQAYPTISLVASDSRSGFGSAPLILGSPPDQAAKDPSRLEVAKGRRLTGTDAGKVVIGSTIATQKKASVGDTITILGQPFEVVGILQYINSEPDHYYIMNITDAQALMQAQRTFTPATTGLVTNINVIPKPGVDTTKLASTLEQKFPGTQATPPDTIKSQIQSASQVLNLIVLGSALIAVLVGSLSVINTMLVSVSERRKEIGIKRVVGARNRHLLKEVMFETGLIGLIGGLVGFAAGAGVVAFINSQAKGTGFALTLTPELAGIAVGFAVVPGVLAGLYPAWRALRIKPVEVLREE